RSHDRTKVLRVFDSVENDKERRRTGARGDQLLEGHGLGSCELRHDTLVRGTADGAIEVAGTDPPHRNAGALGDVRHACRAAARVIADAHRFCTPGPNRLEHWVDAVDQHAEPYRGRKREARAISCAPALQRTRPRVRDTRESVV